MSTARIPDGTPIEVIAADVIVAIIERDRAAAERMLTGVPESDLVTLTRAAMELQQLGLQAQVRMRPR